MKKTLSHIWVNTVHSAYSQKSGVPEILNVHPGPKRSFANYFWIASYNRAHTHSDMRVVCSPHKDKSAVKYIELLASLGGMKLVWKAVFELPL